MRIAVLPATVWFIAAIALTLPGALPADAATVRASDGRPAPDSDTDGPVWFDLDLVLRDIPAYVLFATSSPRADEPPPGIFEASAAWSAGAAGGTPAGRPVPFVEASPLPVVSLPPSLALGLTGLAAFAMFRLAAARTGRRRIRLAR